VGVPDLGNTSEEEEKTGNEWGLLTLAIPVRRRRRRAMSGGSLVGTSSSSIICSQVPL
jgi:hypothetical protein